MSDSKTVVPQWGMLIVAAISLFLQWRQQFGAAGIGGWQMSQYLPFVVIAVAIVAGGALNVWASRGRRNAPNRSKPQTEARLRFFGDSRSPVKDGEQKNIWRFFSIAVTQMQTGQTDGTLLFIEFDQPISSGMAAPQVTMEGARLPVYEVKDFEPRSVIIAFHGVIPTRCAHISSVVLGLQEFVERPAMVREPDLQCVCHAQRLMNATEVVPSHEHGHDALRPLKSL